MDRPREPRISDEMLDECFRAESRVPDAVMLTAIVFNFAEPLESICVGDVLADLQSSRARERELEAALREAAALIEEDAERHRATMMAYAGKFPHTAAKAAGACDARDSWLARLGALGCRESRESHPRSHRCSWGCSGSQEG